MCNAIFLSSQHTGTKLQWTSTVYQSNWFFRALCPPELYHQRVQWSVTFPLTFNHCQCLPWRHWLRCWILTCICLIDGCLSGEKSRDSVPRSDVTA